MSKAQSHQGRVVTKTRNRELIESWSWVLPASEARSRTHVPCLILYSSSHEAAWNRMFGHLWLVNTRPGGYIIFSHSLS